MMVGRPRGAVKAPRSDPRCARPADDPREHGPGWGHFGPVGGGPLREEWSHNGIEYGLMQAYPRGLQPLSTAIRVRNSITRRSRTSGCRASVGPPRGSASSPPRPSDEEGQTSWAAIAPYVEDSGEGRWTVEDSIDKRIATPVITTSLYERFSFAWAEKRPSRQRSNAALRKPVSGGPRRQEGGAKLSDEQPNPTRPRGSNGFPVHPTTLRDLRRDGRTSARPQSCCRRCTTSRHEGALPEALPSDRRVFSVRQGPRGTTRRGA